MKLLQSILSVAGFPTSPAPVDSSVPALPTDHPASIQFSSWLSAFNTADRETLEAYHTDQSFPVSVLQGGDKAIDLEVYKAKMMGSFDIADVESSDHPSFVVVVLKGRKYSQHVRVNMSVDTLRPSYPVTEFTFRPAITPLHLIPKDYPRRSEYEKAMAPLTTPRRQAVLDDIAEVFRGHYVNATVGEEIIAILDANVKNGDYENIHDNEKFASRLTSDLRYYDKHLFVAVFEPPLGRNDSESGPKPQKRIEEIRADNFGFGNTSFDTESVPGRTIATLPINAFIPTDARYGSDAEEILLAIQGIVDSVAEADALIFDLRNNYGGFPKTAALIQSYFLDDGPLHLLDMVDRNGTVKQSLSTLPIDELPVGFKRFGGTKPLFVLTSNHTISGGEDMAYSLQAFKRAQAIIGEGNEATAGAANPITQTRFIAEETFGKGWWFIAVADQRPVHAITGTNWEGVGVKSDIVAGKGEWEGVKCAKEVARQLAIRALQLEKEL